MDLWGNITDGNTELDFKGSFPETMLNGKMNSSHYIRSNEVSCFYFLSHFACIFVFSELLRSQNNFEDHNPVYCMNNVTIWKNETLCKTDPTFAAAGPQVGCEHLEQVKIYSHLAIKRGR